MSPDVGSLATAGVGDPVDDATTRRIERFLYDEATLVDERRFGDWLELFTDDLVYRAPIRVWRDDASRQVDPVACYFSDTKETLAIRVQRIATGLAWAESPPSVTRHFVSNCRAFRASEGDELIVHANVLVTRSRGPNVGQEVFAMGRSDVVRPSQSTYRIASRTVVLDSPMPAAQNLAIFF